MRDIYIGSECGICSDRYSVGVSAVADRWVTATSYNNTALTDTG